MAHPRTSPPWKQLFAIKWVTNREESTVSEVKIWYRCTIVHCCQREVVLVENYCTVLYCTVLYVVLYLFVLGTVAHIEHVRIVSKFSH